MAPALKHYYDKPYFEKLSNTIVAVYPDFCSQSFLQHIFDNAWEQRELKARMHHTTQCLADHLPSEYPLTIDILKQAAPLSAKNSKYSGFLDMFFSDFVEKFGMNDWDTSMDALEYFTPYASSEFAIRPFIIKDTKRAMQQLAAWSLHPSHHVRRLASEGCRPRLPWACALPMFKKDPSLILPILENLKNDPSEYVRRSVANNLNDISKDHPHTLLKIAKKWHGDSQKTDRLVKHACRNLLKKGDQDALTIFGLQRTPHIKLQSFSVQEKTIHKGMKNKFYCQFKIQDDCRIRFEYRIAFSLKSGKTSHKVYQISEKEYQKGSFTLNIQHAFIDRSTRTLSPGTYQITLVANGAPLASDTFELLETA